MRNTFFTGLLIVIPLIVTAYVIYAIIGTIDGFIAPIFKNIIQGFTEKEFYLPGMGLLFFVALTYFVGVVASNYMGKRILFYGESILKKIPFVKWIYTSVKDMTDALSSDRIKSFKEIALIEFPLKGRYVIGFITGRLEGREGKRFCTVFIPTTPNPTSGFLVIIPEGEITPISLSTEDAIKYIISLGTTRIDLEWTEKSS
ncbi:MAG: DUF502 domain-containing protein [Syntrophorhabdaceae bacterium]|nr:DUF502 domain-containing protein [Syntrophorhabdaceae bacterium]